MSDRYRFRGAVKPRAELKRPVLNTVTGEKDESGATLWIYDVIDSWGGDWGISAREFAEALSRVGDVPEIRLHVNSPGGECHEAIAIMNQLRRHPAKVIAVVDGIAASAASFIAASADEVVMSPNSEMMIHDAWGFAMGPASEMISAAEQLTRISDNIASVYASRSNSAADVEAWRALMLAETWFSAEEAVIAGLADRVGGAESTESVEPVEAFDLSMFRWQSRVAAPPVPELASKAEDDGARERRVRQNHNRMRFAQLRARH